MKYSFLIWSCITAVLISCQNKKLTEYNVEVPLPSKEEKLPPLKPEEVKADEGAFPLQKLDYAFTDFSSTIDATTMEIHYSKHYLSHLNNLNKIIKGTDKEPMTITEILKKAKLNETELRNHAGGYFNHNLYWEIISPKAGGAPKDSLASAINAHFGGFEEFKTIFRNAAKNQIGSGWVWLIVDKEGKLQVTATQNNDNPVMSKASVPGIPIMVIDLWEHAYYLNYQYRKKDYVNAYFEIVNWDKVGKKFESTFK
jgi:superoxide dismutase, Fe-Mn family